MSQFWKEAIVKLLMLIAEVVATIVTSETKDDK